jgi:hypothetical protein
LRNLSLIRIDPLTNLEIEGIQVSETDLQPDVIKESFFGWEFSSVLKEKPWKKFIETFELICEEKTVA